MADRPSYRAQVAERVGRARAVEQEIAEALKATRQFIGDLRGEDLEPIFENVLHRLVEEQRFAGLNVPISHHVSAMQVTIGKQAAAVAAEVQIMQPIVAVVHFAYALENDPKAKGKLRLKNDEVRVTEHTKAMDFAAKAALKLLNVAAIARHELRDPNGIIRRTLPTQLRHFGMDAQLGGITLTLTPQDRLHVEIKVS